MTFTKKTKALMAISLISIIYLIQIIILYISSWDGLKLDLPREGWHTNLSSWADQEVIDRFNGIFFQFEEIKLTPYDFFSSILLRMKDRAFQLILITT